MENVTNFWRMADPHPSGSIIEIAGEGEGRITRRRR